MPHVFTTERNIEPWGTAARIVVGTAMIGTALVFGLDFLAVAARRPKRVPDLPPCRRC